MKNFTNNFKQFTSHLSARWLIMALMMLVGTSSAWAANRVIFLYTGSVNYPADNAVIVAHAWGDNSDYDVIMTKAADNYYKAEIPDTKTKILFVRLKNGSTLPLNWADKWNQTGDLTIQSGNNCFKPTGWDGATTTWSTYQLTSNASLSASSTTVNTNTNVTLTPSLTSNTTYNQIKSTSYAISPSTGASVSGNTFTATAAGEYTVTATVTYNAIGFTGITKTATATKTITVTAPVTTYTISYNNNGGSGTIASQTKTKGTPITLSDGSGFSKTGYTLDSWNTKADGSGTSYVKGASYTTDAALTLYAQWKINTYTITYNSNGGTGTISSQTKNHNTAITLSDGSGFSKTGYTFTGWNTAANGSGTAYESGASYTANAAATLYAQWKANQYTINYKDQGGAAFSGTHASGHPTTHTYGTATTLKTASKTGYTFGGWFTNSACTGTKVTSLGATAYTADITLYAKWTVITYTITYNANNGSGAPDAQTKTYNVALTLSSTKPTRTGYTFQNWNTKSDGTGTTYASGASYTANAAATLYAQWKADTYTITYDANGGVNPPAAQTKTYGVSLTLTSSKPTREGYTFTGWNTAANGSGTAYASGGTFTTNAATTLYAQWEEICDQTATGGTGSYSNGTITLSAKFNTCGDAYIGFQWKEDGKDWCYDNSNDCYVQLGVNNKKNETVTATVTKPSGNSYVFRPYIVVGNDAKNWLYGTDFTVGTCTLPIINSTDASFNQNNFADFAALYVTDCSGKEVTAYQWYKGGEEYVSKCEYTTKDGGVTGDAGKTNNIRPNAAGNYTCKVTYKDGTSATSAPFAVTATSGETKADFKSNLPVIMVNTGSKDFPDCPAANETASKNAEKMKKKLSVDVKILFDGNIVYDRKARMAYRGSSSLNFQKKSYAFCPGDANCGDADKGPDYVKTAKLNMLGIGEAADKDWVLYAAAADPSMLRNRMVFETYQAMRPGEWGVKSRYVELIINGEYKGVYLMMDKITQNKKRVNVEWDVKDETKRGFILKFDKTDIPDRSVDYPDGDEKTFLSKYSGKYDITTYDAQVDQAFEIEYPEKGDIEDEGGNWYDVINFIQGMINNFETALSAGEYQKVQQIIDYESWADWFILSEYTKNVDAFRASCVFVYDGTKLKATPLWDQELSFNNQSVHANRYTGDTGNKGCENVTGLLIQNEKVYTDGFAAPFWFTGILAGGKGTEKLAAKTFTGALLNDPCFVQMVKNRWEAHKSGALSNASLTALITNYEKELTDAVREREQDFWDDNNYSRNTLSCSWGSNTTGYYDNTYAEAKAHITAWISDDPADKGTGRRDGLDDAIDALEGTGLDIAIKPASIQTTPWVPVVIQVQNETGYEYTLTYTDGELDKQPNIIIEISGDTYKYHIPRPAAWPAGNEQVEGERADINYGIKATLQVGEGNKQCGSSAELPSAAAIITLQDEPNEDCQ